ncbi:transcription elongation factor GreA ['Crotalaria aegyptiaca' phytoplasma]|uniref:Transcription elongation factor GreA n=1 Tax=Candidatus Phytoplasma crotalariae TaxID=2982627 RepID=A0ABT9D611_9MOLU|nr:transcription elongation factor GreA ['Crotalaria aegyptiaca' phytoplasma]MDO8059388.1 transcription elongation factor GreA ['Crotalaria aegyptiaca' phytoplasma]
MNHDIIDSYMNKYKVDKKNIPKDKQIYKLTREGLDKLKQELEHLTSTKRSENLISLKEARDQGDLSENADYAAATNEQIIIETRISEIKNILKNTEIIDHSNQNKEIVTIGNTVDIQFLDNMQILKLHLVGILEVDPLNNKFSIESPIGQSLQGHKEGDQVKYKSETGKIIDIKILKIY